MRLLGISLLCFLCTSQAISAVRLPAFFSNHMVLQRDKPIHIWGFASYENTVTVVFDTNEQVIEVESDGFFEAEFDALPADGKVHVIRVVGTQTIDIQDVVIGDVFIVGGQSNMEWPMNRINDAELELSDTNYPNIRMFTVPRSIKSQPAFDLEADGWVISSKESAQEFSAIGYLIARKLHLNYKIPIGVIDNSWGGTNIQGWCPEEAFGGMTDLNAKIRLFQSKHDNSSNFQAAAQKWAEGLDINDLGIAQAWSEPEVSKAEWKDVQIPGIWEQIEGYEQTDGIMWFSHKINIIKPTSDECILSLGMIDDGDITYINGVIIGSTDQQYDAKRYYTFSSNLLNTGSNEIVVRVKDTGGGGGFHSIPDSLYLIMDGKKTSLAGTWKMAEGTKDYAPMSDTYEANAYPTNRYNGMVNPLVGLATKGYLYYQGESDTYQPKVYQELLQRMIRTYRTNFSDQAMPFVIVQLANYLKEDELPVESNWAELRNAQAAALTLPYTGLVTTIDVGDANDIHPRNKQTVAERATRVLKRIAYGESLVFEGPIVNNFERNQYGYLLTFDNIGEGGLAIKGNPNTINGFSAKKADGTLISLNAKVLSKTSILLEVKEPITHIRYLWANNPGQVQIYNGAGLPMSPFEKKL